METLNTYYDNVEVFHNGVLVFRKSSTEDGQNDNSATETFSTSVIIDVSEERACDGHLIRIQGGTEDSTANNGVGWTATITVT